MRIRLRFNQFIAASGFLSKPFELGVDRRVVYPAADYLAALSCTISGVRVADDYLMPGL